MVSGSRLRKIVERCDYDQTIESNTLKIIFTDHTTVQAQYQNDVDWKFGVVLRIHQDPKTGHLVLEPK